VAYILFGIGNIIDKTALTYMETIPYTTVNLILGTLSIFLYSYFILKNTQYHALREHGYTIGFIGVLIGISTLCMSQAFLLSPNPGYVGALQNMHILFTSLY